MSSKAILGIAREMLESESVRNQALHERQQTESNFVRSWSSSNVNEAPLDFIDDLNACIQKVKGLGDSREGKQHKRDIDKAIQTLEGIKSSMRKNMSESDLPSDYGKRGQFLVSKYGAPSKGQDIDFFDKNGDKQYGIVKSVTGGKIGIEYKDENTGKKKTIRLDMVKG